jgi:hypothetical protein
VKAIFFQPETNLFKHRQLFFQISEEGPKQGRSLESIGKL